MSELAEEITVRTTTEIDVSDLEVGGGATPGRACIVLHAEGRADVVHLRHPQDAVVVGRSFPADVCVRSASLSRQHARFTYADGRVQVEDLGSRNGTWLRGQRIEQTALRSGDEVFLGSVKATLSLISHGGGLTRQTPTPEPGGVVLCDPQMKALYALVRRVAKSDVTVLVVGETGTGKEHVASSLHGMGPRAARPFKAINCGAIPEHLTSSILFGHERGAFTGAHQRTPGVFEQAQGGTVFLDEIGELPPAVQATLLRVLETRRVVRVGSTQEIPLDVRVVAATHCDVERMVREGTFRQDLLYRLNALTLEVPPLRQRPAEIEPLCRHFMRRAESDWERPPGSIDDDALSLLRRHRWPGNIRQLRNAIERAVLLRTGELIRTADLPEEFHRQPTPSPVDLPSPQGATGAGPADPAAASFRDQVRALEVELIERAMQQTGGNQRAAAKLLRMPRRTLVYKLRAYELGGSGQAGVPDGSEG